MEPIMGFDEVVEVVDALNQDGDKVDDQNQDGNKVDALNQNGNKVTELNQNGNKVTKLNPDEVDEVVDELNPDGDKVTELNPDEVDEDERVDKNDEVDEDDEVDGYEGLHQDFDEDDLFRYVRQYDDTNGLDVEEALSQGLISVDDLVPRGKNAPTVDSFTTSELNALWEEEEF